MAIMLTRIHFYIYKDAHYRGVSYFQHLSFTVDHAYIHSCASQDIKSFAALMEIMVQWVGYKRDDCSQNNL